MKRALIFDADPVSREHTEQSFIKNGYGTTTCGMYDEAIEHAGTGTYQGIGLHMHDTEEMQLVLRIHEMQPNARIFVQGDKDTLAVNLSALIEMNAIVLIYNGPRSAIPQASM